MTLTEKNAIDHRLAAIKARLSERYEMLDINGESFFRTNGGTFFRIYAFPGEMALVIEYADSERDAKLHRLEDGDRFYMEDLSLDDMFKQMVSEIEGA